MALEPFGGAYRFRVETFASTFDLVLRTALDGLGGLASDALPTSLLLADFARAEIDFETAGFDEATGRLDRLTLTPLPVAAWLLGAALLAAVLGGRWRG